jgi:YD repeat-containing protein
VGHAYCGDAARGQERGQRSEQADWRNQAPTQTDDNNIVIKYAYDDLGRLDEVIANYQPVVSPTADINVSTHFQYDLMGNLTRLTDPRSYTTVFTYDKIGRMETVKDNTSDSSYPSHLATKRQKEKRH